MNYNRFKAACERAPDQDPVKIGQKHGLGLLQATGFAGRLAAERGETNRHRPFVVKVKKRRNKK